MAVVKNEVASKSGYYMVQQPSGVCPVWLNDLNGEFWHYKEKQDKWEKVAEKRIIRKV